MSNSPIENENLAASHEATERLLSVQPIDIQWPARRGLVVDTLRTYGYGIGSEYVYCYTFPAHLELARLKKEDKFKIKIGKADGDPIGRICQQVAGTKTALSQLPQVLLIFQTLASRHLESWLHSRLIRSADAVGSEWFETNPEELIAPFDQYAQEATSPIHASAAADQQAPLIDQKSEHVSAHSTPASKRSNPRSTPIQQKASQSSDDLSPITKMRHAIIDAITAGNATLGTINKEWGWRGLCNIARRLRSGHYVIEGIQRDAHFCEDADANNRLAERLQGMPPETKIKLESAPRTFKKK